MSKFTNVLLVTMALTLWSPAHAQFSATMSAEELQQEVTLRIATQPMAETIRAMLEAGLEVEAILSSFVGLIGLPGFEALSLESIVQEAVVAGVPAPTVVSVLINVVYAKRGNVTVAQIDAIIASAVAAEILVNGNNANVSAIAQAAAETGKISLAEANAVAGAAQVAVIAPSRSEVVEPVEPVISTR